MKENKVEDKNPSDILDQIADVKCKISFLTFSLETILVDAGHCDETVCGLQAIMLSLEDDLDKISSAFDKKFNLPSDENAGRER
jgi:hypothetical protein